MFEVISKTKIMKIKENFYPKNLKAGIIYNKDGVALDKIMFYEEENVAKDIFNDTIYSLSNESMVYVSDIVSLEKIFIEYLGNGPYTLVQIYMGYKMFINDSYFLNKHLIDFGMFVRDVGYKCKLEIARDPDSVNYELQDLFLGLIHIINYKDLNYKEKEFELPNATKRK